MLDKRPGSFMFYLLCATIVAQPAVFFLRHQDFHYAALFVVPALALIVAAGCNLQER